MFVASTDENLVVHDHSVVVVEEPTLTVEAACLKKKSLQVLLYVTYKSYCIMMYNTHNVYGLQGVDFCDIK